jgi:hypothetical protein
MELLTRVFEFIQVHRSSQEKFPHPFATKRFHNFCEAEKAISWPPLTMHICKYWRETVLSTPSLGSDIHLMLKTERKTIGVFTHLLHFSYGPVPRHSTSQFISTPIIGISPSQQSSMRLSKPLPTEQKLCKFIGWGDLLTQERRMILWQLYCKINNRWKTHTLDQILHTLKRQCLFLHRFTRF